MTLEQKNLLVSLIKKYFEGGNDRAKPLGGLKQALEDIRDFVTENF